MSGLLYLLIDCMGFCVCVITVYAFVCYVYGFLWLRTMSGLLCRFIHCMGFCEISVCALVRVLQLLYACVFDVLELLWECVGASACLLIACALVRILQLVYVYCIVYCVWFMYRLSYVYLYMPVWSMSWLFCLFIYFTGFCLSDLCVSAYSLHCLLCAMFLRFCMFLWQVFGFCDLFLDICAFIVGNIAWYQRLIGVLCVTIVIYLVCAFGFCTVFGL